MREYQGKNGKRAEHKGGNLNSNCIETGRNNPGEERNKNKYDLTKKKKANTDK